VFTARVVRLQDGWLVAERPFDSADMAARHLLLLLSMVKWDGDRDEALATLAGGVPIEWKGMSYRVVLPTAITELIEEVRKVGESHGRR